MQEVSRSYDQADENARQVVRRTRNVTRRKYTPEEKVRTVIEGIRGEISVSVYVVKTSGTKGEPLKRATWTLTGSGSSQICQPPFG